MYKEGQWSRKYFAEGTDSHWHGINHNTTSKYANIKNIKLGTIEFVQPEPLYDQTVVTIKLVQGGTLTNVAWPGAQVNANPSGTIPGGAVIGIHGLWDPPLPGREVVIGFIDGSHGNPVVLNKYSYNSLHRPDLVALHKLPFISKGHNPLDVVLGSFTGSFIAIRGLLPLPASIEIQSLSSINVFASAFITNTSVANYDITAGTIVNITSGVATNITATTGVNITAGTNVVLAGTGVTISALSPVLITGVPGVTINSGIRPVAALGDVVPTLLGPSPIAATGVACLVP